MMKGKNFEITAKNIFGHEMIGLEVKVIKSTDPSRTGIEGMVVDETQNTFKIKGKHGSEKKVYIIPKKECEFEFVIGDEKAIVNGSEIVKRPQDRAKEWKN